jgi:hypothetical protein
MKSRKREKSSQLDNQKKREEVLDKKLKMLVRQKKELTGWEFRVMGGKYKSK